MAGVAMAKAKKKAGAKSEPERVRTAAIMLRGMPEWKDWVERLAEYDRAPSVNELADRAFVAYARAIGFKEAAPKR
jgi:hypothetical protein